MSLRDRIKVSIVIAISVAGVWLISSQLLIHNSIRLDEAQSLWQTSHSLRGTLKVIAQDVHVPLYHILLHHWQIIFGQSIETARMLSLLFFILSIPVVYLLARRILSVNWSLLVVLLFSFSPFMNWYANEARMYTLLVFVTLLNQLYFTKIVQTKGRKGWLGYLLSASVGIYSHYFFMFSLLSQAIYVLLTRKRYVKRTLLKFTAVAATLAALFIPWFLYFRSLGSASNTSPNLQTPSSIDFFNVYSQFMFGFQTDVLNTIFVSLWPILVLVALLSVNKGQRFEPKVIYMLTAAILPVVLAFIISATVTPFFVSRYMIACLAPLLILLVWLVSHYKRPLYTSIVILLVLVTGLTSWRQYTSAETPVKEDFKTAAADIGRDARASDIVVLSAPFSVYPFNYYYDGDAKVTTLPLWDRTVPGPLPAFDKGKLDAQAKQLNDNHQYVYLLLSSDQGYQEDIFQYYEQRFENTASYRYSPDLELQVYRVGYNQDPAIGEL
ncbi:MAG TPA: glycosyltransferase family 39 protein [Candidatus Saccharimonadales bacterium]|jgi:uncharacterized membrane protein